MNPTLIFSVLPALAAAVWSVWTWSDEQQKERRVKRDQEAALYLNSLLVATEELQTRLYSILEEDELAFYKKEYPDRYEFGSPAAIEILYRLGQYFGWAHRTYRYGPYTHDPGFMVLTREISKLWESREYPGNAFRFSIDERVSLGQAVVRHVGEVSALLPVFESIPLYQFERDMSDEQGKYAQLYQSKAVRCTLAAIDRADKAEALEGHERLAPLQNLLVDLLAYIEDREGFTVSIGDRRKAHVRGVHVRAFPGQPSPAKILHQIRGRIRLRVPLLKTDDASANRLRSLLESLEDVTSIRISASAASVVICYSPDIPDATFAQKAMKTIEEALVVSSVS